MPRSFVLAHVPRTSSRSSFCLIFSLLLCCRFAVSGCTSVQAAVRSIACVQAKRSSPAARQAESQYLTSFVSSQRTVHFRCGCTFLLARSIARSTAIACSSALGHPGQLDLLNRAPYLQYPSRIGSLHHDTRCQHLMYNPGPPAMSRPCTHVRSPSSSSTS